MLAEFIVMFRESLEVAFVIGIILAYLNRTGNAAEEKHVWLGVSSGIVLSIALAGSILAFRADFESNEPLFEGIFMVVTAGLVTWLLLWMARQKNVVERLRGDAKAALAKGGGRGIFLLALVATLREGVEAVLFMAGIYASTGALSLLGAFIGIAAAVVVGFLVFEYAVKFSIGLFFRVTALVLVLLAAGLFSQGVHELQEAKILPVWIEHVYDINPPLNADGSYPALHDHGAVGSVLKGLVGYDGAPSDLQVLGYLGYLGVVYLLYRMP
jgi:high-affinity iron transporter